jgi:beta-lactamase regulating signal transducer with metallopeptidase domain
MQTLLEVGLSNAVMAAGLAMIACLARLVCRRPALVHALWLLVLLKLVTPPLLSFNIRPAPRPVETAPSPKREEAALVGSEWICTEESQPPPAPVEELLPEMAEVQLAAEESPAAEECTEPRWADWPDPPGGWVGLLAGMWLVGSAFWFALAIRRVWSFSLALRHARPAPALQSRVNALARRMGLSICPAVRLLPGRLAPLIWGVSRPVLLVPEGLESMVGNSGLDTLLLHELAHVRRRDHLVRLLEFVVLGLFWWNPVAWYARREMREAEEQCCDAWVVRTLPGTGRTYATALVDALDFLCGTRPALPPLASGLGEVADLKRRLKMILTGKTPHGLGRSNGLAVLGLALFLLPLVPVWGQAQTAAEEEKRAIINLIESDDAPGGDAKKLEAEVEKKVAELAELKARMAQLKKLAAELARKKAADALSRARVARGQRSTGPVIRIEISDLNLKADELKDLVKKLETVLPGKEKRVLIVTSKDQRVETVLGGRSGATIRGRFRSDAEAPKAPMAGPGVPSRPAPPMRPGMAPPGGIRAGSSDRRIDNLERKLDQLLRELEALRRDMRRGGQSGGSGGAGGGLSAPAKREVE